jgi:hypothetical protein
MTKRKEIRFILGSILAAVALLCFPSIAQAQTTTYALQVQSNTTASLTFEYGGTCSTDTIWAFPSSVTDANLGGTCDSGDFPCNGGFSQANGEPWTAVASYDDSGHLGVIEMSLFDESTTAGTFNTSTLDISWTPVISLSATGTYMSQQL